MTEWQPIETAPKDRVVMLFGRIDPATEFGELRWEENLVFSGSWDELDESWCPLGGTWRGPFMECTHWKPLPEPPK